MFVILKRNDKGKLSIYWFIIFDATFLRQPLFSFISIKFRQVLLYRNQRKHTQTHTHTHMHKYTYTNTNKIHNSALTSWHRNEKIVAWIHRSYLRFPTNTHVNRVENILEQVLRWERWKSNFPVYYRPTTNKHEGYLGSSTSKKD